MNPEIKRGSEFTLAIESLASGGQGVARHNGYVLFVDGAIPGQRVQAKVTRRRKEYAEARALQILQQSTYEVEPRCPHFGECGGCRLQNLAYEAQLRFKRQHVEESLRRIGGFGSASVLDPIPSPEPFYYRNKMEFSFGSQRWLSAQELQSDEIRKPKDFALGLHVRGRFDKILDLDMCCLQSQQSVAILDHVREFVITGGLPVYSTKDHSGFWRHLVIREGKNTGESMINLVTAGREKFYGVVDSLAHNLKDAFPDITTVVHSINRSRAQVAVGEEQRVLIGPGTITEKVGDRLFQISPNSFFQTNTKAVEALYSGVGQLADLQSHHTLYDLYSGAGAISLYLANRVAKVIGFEIVASAVEDAKVNCKLNAIENCTFVAGDLKDSLKSWRRGAHSGNGPDVIIIDPPRAGMHAKVVREVAKLQSEKIVYVSCNPMTFARDAKLLYDDGYQLKVVQPVDMFPHTPHIELVGLLTLAN